MFATDRHLLILEPNLPRDVGWVGQRPVKGVGDVAGTTLTMTEQDVGFDEAGVEADGIVIVGGVAYEIIERQSATALTISRLRSGEAILIPSPAAAAAVEVFTYRPQLALVHDQILRMLGISGSPGGPGDSVTEADITNPGDLMLLEALGALHLVFAAASALAGSESPAAFKAAMYRDRFAAERSRAAARIDTDGDGQPDATRRPSVITLVRA